MSEITCPVCGEGFEVERDTGEGRVCRKAKCAKKRQRMMKAGTWDMYLQSVAGGAARAPKPTQKKPAARGITIVASGPVDVVEEDFLDGPSAVEKLRKAGAHVREGLLSPELKAAHAARVQEGKEMADFAAGKIDSAGQPCTSKAVESARESLKKTAAAVKSLSYMGSAPTVTEAFEKMEAMHVPGLADLQTPPMQYPSHAIAPKIPARAEFRAVAVDLEDQSNATADKVKRALDPNREARKMLKKKVPRHSSMPAPVHVPASSILARLKVTLPTSPVVLPRGKTLPKP